MSDLHDNVQKALDSAGIEYKVHRHADLPSSIRSPQDFAAALGYVIQRITKTLFVRSHDGTFFGIVVCGMDKRVDFKALAVIFEQKRLEGASQADLAERLSYPKNGVSPLGVSSDIPVAIDKDLLNYPTVLVGGGVTAVEVEMAPNDLVALTHGHLEAVAS